MYVPFYLIFINIFLKVIIFMQDMSILYVLIAVMVILDLSLFALNKFLSHLRRRDVRNMMKHNEMKKKLVDKIDSLNAEIESIKKNNVPIEKYNELLRNYYLLLDQYRVLRDKLSKRR